MSETKYCVLFDDTVIARDMSIEVATILIKACANEYYYNNMKYGSQISLKREEECTLFKDVDSDE